MPAETQLVGTNADRLLTEIRRSTNTSSPEEARPSAVIFHPEYPAIAEIDPFHEGAAAVLQEAEMCREDTLAGDVLRLKRLHVELYSRAAETGTIPPSPPSVRGRVGRIAMQAIHRLLWWHEGALRRFAAMVLRTSGWQTVVIDRMAQDYEAQTHVLASLEDSIRALQQEVESIRAENAQLKQRILELGSQIGAANLYRSARQGSGCSEP